MTITIPMDGRGDTPVTVYVNGVKYAVPRGVEVTVPDAVAAETQKLGIALLKEADDGTMWAMPKVTAADNGKILKVADGKWTMEDVPTELPAVSTTDNGKILRVVNGKWAVSDETVELPAVSGDDDDKVLTVVSGAWAAAALPADDVVEPLT